MLRMRYLSSHLYFGRRCKGLGLIATCATWITTCQLVHFRNISRELERTLRTSRMSQLCELPNVRGMKKLDKEAFTKVVRVPVLRIEENLIGSAVKHLRKYLLKLDKFKPVQALDHDTEMRRMKCIFLNPLLCSSFDSIDERARDGLKKTGVSEEQFSTEDLKLTYDNWKADEILKAILPEDKEKVSGYSIIGHIVHLNLRDHLLDYKNVVGEVLLDKVIGARTVVNKTNIIDSTYRNFHMEILAGEEDMKVQVRENFCVFEFDFSQVYWNPRLSTEHERILKMLTPGDILYDVFAGVGPFAVPVGKKKCSVLANDLNPESHKWLRHNIELNKVQSYVTPFNKDGRDFIKQDVRKDLIERLKQTKQESQNIHITMNLPALAVEFLDAFIGLLPGEDVSCLINHLTVHVYCFTKEENPETTAKIMVESVLQCDLGSDIKNIHHVRNVAPNKEMMRVSFQLPEHVLQGKQLNMNVPVISNEEVSVDEPSCKKTRISNN